MEARRFEPEVRPDWRSVNLEIVSARHIQANDQKFIYLNAFLCFHPSKMDMVLEYKFTQHPKLMAELLKTGDAKLVEVR